MANDNEAWSTHSISRRNAIKTLGAAGTIGLAGCLGGTGGGDSGGVKAAFVYNSTVGDLGWIYAHDIARKKLEEKYSDDWLTVETTENVAVGEFSKVGEQYARNGYDIIYGTTYGYMDPMYKLSKRFPNVYWENSTGFKIREPNMGCYLVRFYQVRYLVGLIAGMVTESNELGYVGSFPAAFPVNDVNALTLGARAVNPDVRTSVRWIQSWKSPSKATKAAQSLIDEGADVIAQVTNSPAAVKTAAEAGVWNSGIYAPMRRFGGDKYVSSPVANWIDYYEPQTLEVKNDEYKANRYWGGLKENGIVRDKTGSAVPQKAINKAEKAAKKIKNGDLHIWEGTQFEDKSDAWMYANPHSYVEGINGSLK